MTFARRDKARERKPLTARELEDAALRYLNRFDCSVDKLRKHLRGLVRRRGGDAALGEHIEMLLERYRASGLVNDERFAGNLTERLQSRGASRRMVVQKLRLRGVARDVAEAAARSSPASELEAARAYARRRRLGPHRPEAERAANRHRDLAALARQGFDHDTASRALGYGADEDF
ncbi:MAG TPA: RecX family transcriptional regulator [Polyangiaceae bacterium]